MVWLPEARAPDDLRLYAVGDVHGCLDALMAVHDAIESDLAARRVADWRVIHVGDYVDRGPDSRGVVEFLIGRMAGDARIICLRGNHDEMFAQGIEGERRTCNTWLTNGGVETLASYGVELTDFLEALREGGVALDLVPEAHRAFLDGLEMSARFGDYYFVHAGVDPRRPLDEQGEEAQLWIRETFLRHADELEAVVVHGHTPVKRVDARGNRIGIDTGAVFGGPLTCLVLEGESKALLTAEGLAPLIPPEPAATAAEGDRRPRRSLRALFGFGNSRGENP